MSDCQFCGYEFDEGALGPHGCPNCCGEGLDDEENNLSESLDDGLIIEL